MLFGGSNQTYGADAALSFLQGTSLVGYYARTQTDLCMLRMLLMFAVLPNGCATDIRRDFRDRISPPGRAPAP